MQLLQKFIDHVKQKDLFQKKDHLLLAVSGGADSVALCELCFQSSFNFSIAHCNFKLRGEESERDEQFVKQLSEKYNVQFFVKKFDTEKYASENKFSIQVAARELRYIWFRELIAEEQISYILTAHHADDNVETLLMNFFKGTGINGLKAIKPKQNKLIRPLLFADKIEIKDFIEQNNLPFVEDSSNASDKYTRNFFRNNLLPDIEKIFPKVSENLKNNIERFSEIQTLYDQAISFHKQKLIERKGTEIHLPVLKLIKSAPLSTIVFEIIKDFGFTANQTSEVIHLLNSESGKYIESETHKIFKNRKWLIITPINNAVSENIIINENDKEIIFSAGKIKISKGLKNKNLSTEINLEFLNADELKFPLLLRKWKQGDYFYPLGMQKKKKLSKFFIDKKLSLSEKENVWVLESNKKIAWVIDLRIDDRFKITDTTKNISAFEFIKT